MESQNKKYLQYVSDIHLELWPVSKKKSSVVKQMPTFPTIMPVFPGSTYLALIGDIGYPHMTNIVEFLEYHSKLFVHIFWIAGNHEYYSSAKKQYTMNEIEEKIVQICEGFSNVTFLQKSTFEIDSTLILGCTLWTDVSQARSLSHTMNDYHCIYIECSRNAYMRRLVSDGNRYRYKKFNRNRNPLSIETVSELNTEMREWIVETIEANPDKDIIILTHHAPSFQMLTRNDDHSIFYANNLDELMNKYNINYWLSGHTHSNQKIKIGNTECRSNCMGYKNESCDYIEGEHVIIKR